MLERLSPGSIFQLDESSMHAHLDELCAIAHGLTLSDDGVGGKAIAIRRGDPFECLERVMRQ
jgi:hypothetical protein